VANPTTDSLAKSLNPQCQRRMLGLFAKVWDPGTVKTRLAKTLGNDKAAQIYFELLSLHLSRFADSADHRAVAYSPATKESETRFEELISQLNPRPNWSLVPQVESDLGTRMSRFFQQQFEASGNQVRVVVIGSDAPRLTCDIVDEAFELLATHDVVYGPSTDGGYYLVGLSKNSEEIFQGIDWSTEKVLEQSLGKCKANGLSVAQLPALTDIDHEEDLVREIQQLEQSKDVFVDAFLSKVAPILERPIS